MSKNYAENFKRGSVYYALGPPEKRRVEIAKELGVPLRHIQSLVQ